MSGLERELKLRLQDGEAAGLLARVLGEPFEIVEQLNVYLDTRARQVASSRSMVRLRREGGRWSLTYKRGLRVQAGYFEAREVEVPLAALPQTDWSELGLSGLEDLAPLEALRADGVPGELAISGEVHNRRSRYRLSQGEVLELDRTRFPDGRVDWEVEVETRRPDEVRGLLADLAQRAGILFEEQDKTKYERFLEALERA